MGKEGWDFSCFIFGGLGFSCLTAGSAVGFFGFGLACWTAGVLVGSFLIAGLVSASFLGLGDFFTLAWGSCLGAVEWVSWENLAAVGILA